MGGQGFCDEHLIASPRDCHILSTTKDLPDAERVKGTCILCISYRKLFSICKSEATLYTHTSLRSRNLNSIFLSPHMYCSAVILAVPRTRVETSTRVLSIS